ncbi:MAG: hypothetical protein D6723_14170 [Acidobacteria bacterium]|nr:MAG: hypothetical protein D6723_14170 [Acidobacteriota bacterium]
MNSRRMRKLSSHGFLSRHVLSWVILVGVILAGVGMSRGLSSPRTRQGLSAGGDERGLRVVSPDDPLVVYTASAVGYILKSTDGGDHWKSVVYGLPVPFTRPTRPPLLVIRSGTPTIIYALLSVPIHSGLIENRLYRSLDGGEHWQELKRLPENWRFFRMTLDPRDDRRLWLDADRGRLAIDDRWGTANWPPAVHVKPAALPWSRFHQSRLVQPPDVDQGNIAVLHDDGTFLELFDLANRTIEFRPNGAGGYDVSFIGFSMESNLGTRLTLGDDETAQVNLGFFFPFYTVSRNFLFVSSNGLVTFDSPDPDGTPSIAEFIAESPRIAALWDDFNPAATSGSDGVFVRSVGGSRVVITWKNLPEFNTTNANTVQLVLFRDGRIRLSYQSVATRDGLVGLSNGGSRTFFRVNFDQDLPASFASPAPILEFFNRGLNTRAVARRFYQTHGDDFDFLVLFGSSTFSHSLAEPGELSFTELVKNAVQGIGLPTFDRTSAFGSGGRLQAIVVMNRLSDFPDDVNEQIGRTTFTTLGLLARAVGRRWGAYVRFNDGGVPSDALLGRHRSEWSFFLDSDGSFLGGNDWRDLGGNTFRSERATIRYSPLDQYVMGLRSSAEVPDFFFIDAPTNTGGRDRTSPPEIGVTVNGVRRTVSINQIIQAEGQRVPGPGGAPTRFRQAFVLIVPQGETANQADLDKLETIRQAWEAAFSAATENRGTVETSLTPPGPDLVVEGLTVSPTTVNPGSTVSVSFSIANRGSQSASSTFHEVRLSTDNIIDGSDVLLATVVTPTLLPGQSIPFSNLTVVIPSTTSTGAHFLGVIADSSSSVVESNEQNNTASTPLNVGSTLADLVATNLTVNPTSVAPGGTVSVGFTVMNQGGGPAGSATHEIRLSADNVIDAGDTLLATVGTPNLPAGAAQTFSNVNVTIPASASPGTQFIGIRVDAGGAVAESDEGNNTATAPLTITAPLPDLVVTGLTINPTAVNPGGTVTVNFTIANQGSGSAGSTTHQIYLSADNLITTADTLLGTVGTSALGAGASTPFTVSVSIPPSTPPGSMFIGVIADTPNLVNELNVGNNTASTPITITAAQADLVVTGLTVTPTAIPPGGTVTVSFSIVNQGTATANSSSHDIRFSVDNVIDAGDALLTTVGTSALSPGSSTPFTVNVTIPATAPSGTRFIGVIVDSGNAVSESNEANNTAMVPITVTAAQPDLVVTNLSVTPTSADAGDQVSITFTITNQGSGSAGPSTQEVRFSDDPTIDASDILMATAPVSDLLPGESQIITLGGVPIPTSATQGTRYIGVIVDAGNAVSESDESNNTGSVTITITSVNESEPNDNALLANPITPDVTIIGTIDPAGDEDYFRLSASALQTITIDVDAATLSPPSPLDSVITLFDTLGVVQLAENDDDGVTSDSFLTYLVLIGGEFTFRIKDFAGNGGPDYKYKIKVSVR